MLCNQQPVRGVHPQATYFLQQHFFIHESALAKIQFTVPGFKCGAIRRKSLHRFI